MQISEAHPSSHNRHHENRSLAHQRLVASPPALSDDTGHLVDLSLRTAEGAEPLLRELAGTLVLGVTEEFDDAALVRGEAVVWLLVVDVGSVEGG